MLALCVILEVASEILHTGWEKRRYSNWQIILIELRNGRILMHRKSITTKSKHPKVQFDHYLLHLNEPTDNTHSDSTRVLEPKLLENSKSMKRHFRRLAGDLRSRRKARTESFEHIPSDRYLGKFNRHERKRIAHQIADMQKAEELELTKIGNYVTERKQRVNAERQGQGLSPI